MDRRRFLLTSLAPLAAPLAAGAQQAAPTRVARIGYLDALKPHDLYEALRLGLRDLGYTEGHNIIIEQRWAEGRWERLPSLAAELVKLNVDLIVASVPSVVRAARNATRQIPIVVVLGGDPVEQGLIDSLARPGSNVTGLASNAFEIVPKQLELLKEVFPKVFRVAVLQNPDAAIPYPVRRAEDAARTLAVRLEIVNARGLAELDGAFAAMSRERVDALVVPAEAIFYEQVCELIAYLERHGHLAHRRPALVRTDHEDLVLPDFVLEQCDAVRILIPAAPSERDGGVVVWVSEWPYA